MIQASPTSAQCVSRAARVSAGPGAAIDMQAIDEFVTSCLQAMRCPACASGRVMQYASLQHTVASVRMDECVA